MLCKIDRRKPLKTTRNIKCIAISIAVLSALVLTSCSTKYAVYSNEMYAGKKLFQEKEYEKAKGYLVQASQDQRNSASLALLGTIYYKTGDLANAESAIREAEGIDKDSGYLLRILGYKSLILLKKDKPEGFKALRQYADCVKNLNIPFEMHDVETMIAKNTVDFDILDAKIEEQATWYENEMEKWNEGNPGYFSDKYGRPM